MVEVRRLCIFFPSLGSRRGRCFGIGYPPWPLPIGRRRRRSRAAAAAAAGGGRQVFRRCFSFPLLLLCVCVCVCVCALVERGRKRKEVLGENFLLFFLPPFLLNRMRQNNFVMKRREKGKKKGYILVCYVYNIHFCLFPLSPLPRFFFFFFFFLVG